MGRFFGCFEENLSGPASAETSTWATHASSKATSAAFEIATAFAAVSAELHAATHHLATGVAVANEVETVDEVEHDVAVDAVAVGVAVACGADVAVDVALLAKDVVELQADSSGILTEEALGNLCVPEQLVGVELCAAVATTAVHVDVGVDLDVLPGDVEVGAGAISELPGVLLVFGLHLVEGVAVSNVPAQGDVHPLVFVGAGESLVDAHLMGGSQWIDGVVKCKGARAQETLAVAVIDARASGDGKVLVGEGGIEVEVAAYVPRAPETVEVGGASDASACLLVVGGLVDNVVQRVAGIEAGADVTQVFGIVVAELDA